MPLFAHFFASASILSAHNRGSVERKYWWASEILSNPNHLAAGLVHATQDADYLSLHLNSGKDGLNPCVNMKLSVTKIPKYYTNYNNN